MGMLALLFFGAGIAGVIYAGQDPRIGRTLTRAMMGVGILFGAGLALILLAASIDSLILLTWAGLLCLLAIGLMPLIGLIAALIRVLSVPSDGGSSRSDDFVIPDDGREPFAGLPSDPIAFRSTPSSMQAMAPHEQRYETAEYGEPDPVSLDEWFGPTMAPDDQREPEEVGAASGAGH